MLLVSGRLSYLVIRYQIEPQWIKAAPVAPLAQRQRRSQPCEGSPPHAGPHYAGHADQDCTHVNMSGGRVRPLTSLPIVQLAATASRSPPASLRDPKLAKLRAKLRGFAARSAPLNLDPASAHPELCGYEVDGGKGLVLISDSVSLRWPSSPRMSHPKRAKGVREVSQQHGEVGQERCGTSLGQLAVDGDGLLESRPAPLPPQSASQSTKPTFDPSPTRLMPASYRETEKKWPKMFGAKQVFT